MSHTGAIASCKYSCPVQPDVINAALATANKLAKDINKSSVKLQQRPITETWRQIIVMSVEFALHTLNFLATQASMTSFASTLSTLRALSATSVYSSDPGHQTEPRSNVKKRKPKRKAKSKTTSKAGTTSLAHEPEEDSMTKNSEAILAPSTVAQSSNSTHDQYLGCASKCKNKRLASDAETEACEAPEKQNNKRRKFVEPGRETLGMGMG